MTENAKVSETPSGRSSTAQARQAMTLILLLAGVAACCVLYPHSSTFNPWSSHDPQELGADALAERVLLFVAAGLALIPATRRILFNLILKLKNPSPASARRNAVAIAILAIPLLYWLAVSHGQILLPGWHDENYYRLQTTMLAHGKLCMPALPLPDFFDVPYVFTRPVYSSMYFPGTSLLHVPGVWFHLPYCAIPLAIAGVTLALLYLIVTELIDGVAGLLAVLLMLSLEVFRFMAVVEMSHAAGTLWGLTAMAAWLAWRKSKARRWVALAGIVAGWYAITRPLDAVCVLLPIALAWGWELRREPMKAKLLSLAIVVGATAPFLALQLAFDRAVTGYLFQTPVSMYYREYLNVRGFGLERYDPNFSPPTTSMLVRDTYLGNSAARAIKFQTIRQATKQWLTERLPMSFAVALPTLLLIVLYPVGLLQLTDLRRAVPWSIFWFYMAGSALVFIFLTQYLMAVAPAIIFSVLLGARALSKACPARNGVEVFLSMAIFALAVHSIFAGGDDHIHRSRMSVERANYVMIPSQVKKPAIVLFRYVSNEPENDFYEPVYNWDVAWPDDASIIRAHDLGASRNRELFNYYARIQPDRTVYLFDREFRSLTELGNVAKLANLNVENGSSK